jgi:hypothetical protein
MTSTNDPLKRLQKIVVFFDFCSSTTILEDLLRSENERQWRDVLIEIKDFLRTESKSLNFGGGKGSSLPLAFENYSGRFYLKLITVIP